MNIDNLNKLIAHLEAQPPERINMGVIDMQYYKTCGTAGCIQGHCKVVFGVGICGALDLMSDEKRHALIMPDGYEKEERNGGARYPAYRVISTLKRLRDTYLSTGQVVVDWGPEPGEEAKQAWTAPQVAEVINPALPAELTSLLRNTVEA